MDKPEDLLLLDVIEVDDEESYSDLIGGEDGLEMEDNTESEYFEEDSEVTEESQEGEGESLDVYVDDTQDDLDADIKDREKSVNSNTEEVQSSDKAENASQRSSSTSSSSVKRLNDDRKTSLVLRGSKAALGRSLGVIVGRDPAAVGKK
uniref:Uncharacterized protein n=1 Tax=Magallana gigas TaxID=29159 RepID=K1RDS7_MAGGI